MKLFNFPAICLTGLILGLAQTPATSFSLDAFTDFEGSNVFQSVSIPAFSSNGTVISDRDPNNTTDPPLDSSVFGGARTLQVTKLDDRLTPDNANLNAFSGSGNFSVPGYSAKAEIIWDGLDGTGSFQNIELDGSEVQDAFEIEIDFLNIGNGIDPNDSTTDIKLNFEIRDTSNNSATITLNFTENINTSTSVLFPYEDRTGNVDLGQIDYIRFYTSDENIGDDFRFSLIQSTRSVPSGESVPFEFDPSLGLIFGGILFGFLKLNKRLERS